ncbi:hypothetical protein BDZ45DRAFT_398363 [Acephala macrosclerotiorum]|nr:hypothetical protein BDZ45DRAFT_398363 [Acephala macrosclerotiorum]
MFPKIVRSRTLHRHFSDKFDHLNASSMLPKLEDRYLAIVYLLAGISAGVDVSGSSKNRRSLNSRPTFQKPEGPTQRVAVRLQTPRIGGTDAH